MQRAFARGFTTQWPMWRLCGRLASRFRTRRSVAS
jgi:hypothetical protein